MVAVVQSSCRHHLDLYYVPVAVGLVERKTDRLREGYGLVRAVCSIKEISVELEVENVKFVPES